MVCVKCAKCVHFINDWCNPKMDSPDPYLIRDCQYYKARTNADRIRMMTDDELKEWYCHNRHCGGCYYLRIGSDNTCGLKSWLSEEAKYNGKYKPSYC